MDAAQPAENISMKDIINEDLKKEFKNILNKHLDDRPFKEEKVKIWIENILNEAKDYFVKKYPDYDLFLLNYIYPRNVYFRSNSSSISYFNTDLLDSVDLSTNDLYSVFYYFFFKHTNLEYSLEEIESEIIQKGNDLLEKYLDERKYDYNTIENYNININTEYMNYIAAKNNKLRCFVVNEIYQKPIKSKYFFKYLCHGKEIHSKIFNKYINDSLICCNSLYFFK